MRIFFIWIVLFAISIGNAQPVNGNYATEILVIGGGTGGTAAGIAAARMGVKALIVQEGPWLGGMISAAGVTCTDGNHNLPSGLWNEFREKIYAVYGGAKAVATGWVSNTQFEPHVSDSIWKAMASAEKNLDVLYGWQFHKVVLENGKVSGAFFKNKSGTSFSVSAKICIDATELGDVMASAGIPFSLGMESGKETGENAGVSHSNTIVQDLTWVATLKDYGKDADCTIAKPVGYNPLEFDGACTDYYINKTNAAPNVDAKKMLAYGKLPNGKYMVNWPNKGNDSYLNVVNLSPEERAKELEKAKQTTLRFVYFIQQQLGFKHLGLADDEFPSADRLALMPYHREGRRLQGLVRMNIKNIADPYNYGDPLYRTGISVGDYPIDHHHKKNPEAPQHLAFYPIPSFNIPLGALIPKKETGLIVAEKGISVTNVVNGTTRLQPVVILTGQAAGVLAGLCVKQNKTPQNVSVRHVQQELMKQGSWIMPYCDVKAGNPYFSSIQRIGATGILKGTGIPNNWANQTWFYPDSLVNAIAFLSSVDTQMLKVKPSFSKPFLTIEDAAKISYSIAKENLIKPQKIDIDAFIKDIEKNWSSWRLYAYIPYRYISRREFAVMLDKMVDPFSQFPVNHMGYFVPQKNESE